MKRILLFIFVFSFFLLASLMPRAYAQQTADDWVNTPMGQAYDAAATGEVNQEAYMLRSSMSQLNAIGCQIMPIMGACTEDPVRLNYLQNRSAIAGIKNNIVAMYTNPPASFGTYMADVGQTLGFAPKRAYAQGVGFSQLEPLLGLWKAFRNISYALLAIILIIIGFMVMFRKRIDPHTVVTIQNAIPRIIITLLLITFSYAIVGLMIDFMYVLIALGISVIGNSGVSGVNVADLQADYLDAGILRFVQAVVLNPLAGFAWKGSLAGAGAGALLGAVFGPAGVLVGGGIGSLVGSIVGGATEGALGDLTFSSIAGGAASPLLMFIFLLALLFGFIRLFFMLISAYVQILLSVVIGPIQILFDALPGGKGFSSWLSNLVGNLLTFPITIIMLIIGAVISQNIGDSDAIWAPPLLGGLDSAKFIKAIIGIGIVMTIPNVVQAAKEAMKAKPALQAGPGVIFGSAAPAVGLMTNAWHFIRQEQVHKSLARQRGQQGAPANAPKPSTSPERGGH